MLTEHDSHYLLNQCMETQNIIQAFEIVKGTGAKLGVDGDKYFYGFGHPAEPDGVFGYGKTPSEALQNFSNAFCSQTIAAPSVQS